MGCPSPRSVAQTCRKPGRWSAFERRRSGIPRKRTSSAESLVIRKTPRIDQGVQFVSRATLLSGLGHMASAATSPGPANRPRVHLASGGLPGELIRWMNSRSPTACRQLQTPTNRWGPGPDPCTGNQPHAGIGFKIPITPHRSRQQNRPTAPRKPRTFGPGRSRHGARFSHIGLLLNTGRLPPFAICARAARAQSRPSRMVTSISRYR
jgi:hypothetical protein